MGPVSSLPTNHYVVMGKKNLLAQGPAREMHFTARSAFDACSPHCLHLGHK